MSGSGEPDHLVIKTYERIERRLRESGHWRRARPPERIEYVLEVLGRAWRANPDMRLGQLIIGAASVSYGHNVDPFYVEDDKMMEALSDFAKKTPKKATTEI